MMERLLLLWCTIALTVAAAGQPLLPERSPWPCGKTLDGVYTLEGGWLQLLLPSGPPDDYSSEGCDDDNDDALLSSSTC